MVTSKTASRVRQRAQQPRELHALTRRRLTARADLRACEPEPATARHTLRILRESNADFVGHVTAVAYLTRLVAIHLRLPASEVDRVELAAVLHDVGKLAIPDSLLGKPGPLDLSESALMRTHALIGERVVRAAPSLAHVADVVRSSHERIDGGGYPDGLAGVGIPLGARIIAVCDAFDAMTSEHPYGVALDPGAALAELRRGAGTQFDAPIVQAFCELAAQPGAKFMRTA